MGRPRKRAPSPEELVLLNEQRRQERHEAKKETVIVGYIYIPYYTRPRKMGYGKLRLKTFNPILGNEYQEPIAKDVPQDIGIKFHSMTPEQATEEYNNRKDKANHGFPRLVKGKLQKAA